ncbi:MAG: hypothetical protein R6U87_05600, partial [Thiohalospira sp.]
MLNKLNRTVITKQLQPKLKMFVYKTYCRPILQYGLESIALNKTEKILLQKTESTLVKGLAGVGK